MIKIILEMCRAYSATTKQIVSNKHLAFYQVQNLTFPTTILFIEFFIFGGNVLNEQFFYSIQGIPLIFK